MFKGFFLFLKKGILGQYDEMVWEDIVHLVILMGIITGLFYIFL